MDSFWDTTPIDVFKVVGPGHHFSDAVSIDNNAAPIDLSRDAVAKEKSSAH